MAKETYIEIVEEQDLNGAVAEVVVGTIVIAVPNKIRVDGSWVENTEGAGRYARLHDLENRTNYIWRGDVDDVDENTALDDPNWEEEN